VAAPGHGLDDVGVANFLFASNHAGNDRHAALFFG